MRQVKVRNGWTFHVLEKWETANPHGRPKKLFSSLALDMKDRGFEPPNPKMIREAYEALLSADRATLEEIKNDEERPEILRTVADYLTRKDGRFLIVESILDRVHGKAVQKYTGEVKHEVDEKGKLAIAKLLAIKKSWQI